MATGSSIVISDVHLGETSPDNERAFLAFLESLPGTADELLINGDLFDFWFEYRCVIPRRYFQAVRRLNELVDAGLRVRLVGGNHDAWVGSFLGHEVGLELLEGPVITEVAGRRAYVAHGDGLLDGELLYRTIRAVTHSGVFRTLFRMVPPDLAFPIARRISGTPARTRGEVKADVQLARRLASHARKVLASRTEIELVIFGHAHRPELLEVEPGRHYLNAGDWVQHRSYAVLEAETIQLKHWHRG